MRKFTGGEKFLTKDSIPQRNVILQKVVDAMLVKF